MTTPSPFDVLAERVELLLAQHEELQHTNRQLVAQLDTLQRERDSLQRERDSLQSRLKAARARVTALIERLPANQEAP